MSGQWKSGDVAMVSIPGRGDVIAMYVDGGMWETPYADADGQTVYQARPAYMGGLVGRPLLVIDPEDMADVERVRNALWSGGTLEHWQAALRSLAQSEDPEPTGLGAVVRDGEGRHWVKYETASPTFHWRRGGKLACGWNDLPRPLTVLSTGWTEDER